VAGRWQLLPGKEAADAIQAEGNLLPERMENADMPDILRSP